MELFETIMQRRSVRKYKDLSVSDEDFQKIMAAAMMAPSAGNAQPWQFIVIRSPETRKKVAEINPYAAMAMTAPVGVLVCGDLSLEKYPGYWVQDCSAATQNMLLAAHGLGLGAIWTGVYPIEERVIAFKKLLNLPEQVIPLGYIAIGHPDQENKPQSRYKEERLHQEKW
jgi:nitroreductase